MSTLKLGFLASHGGSNMQAIIDACKSGDLHMEPAVIISNNAESTALERARTEHIPYRHLSGKTHPDAGELDKAITETLNEHCVDIVILAGYMKKLGPATLAAFPNRILNIHPGILPQYGGKGMFGIHVHEAVIRNKEKETGVTIHLVDEIYDHGRTISYIRIPVHKDDTPQSLQQRVIKQEHILYVDTLRKIVSGELRLDP